MVTLSAKPGCYVYKIGSNLVSKDGRRVTRNEEAALWFARERSSVPVPKVYAARYQQMGRHRDGSLLMQFVEGTTLKSSWDGFDEAAKERICHDIWALIGELRTIPRPAAWAHMAHCNAEGLPAYDVPVQIPTASTADDGSLWSRISERYLCGSARPCNRAREAPPRSVFTHGEVAPRNVMVDADGRITGILGWEKAGWYPDHWEYTKMMAPACEEDWQACMERTKPEGWRWRWGS